MVAHSGRFPQSHQFLSFQELMMQDSLLVPPNAEHFLVAIDIWLGRQWAGFSVLNIRTIALRILLTNPSFIAGVNAMRKILWFVPLNEHLEDSDRYLLIWVREAPSFRLSGPYQWLSITMKCLVEPRLMLSQALLGLSAAIRLKLPPIRRLQSLMAFLRSPSRLYQNHHFWNGATSNHRL